MGELMQTKIQLAIVGGGASGLMAAITAAEMYQGNKRITILESAPRVGKKLLATGNGRCNLTNMNANISHYYCYTKFIQTILNTYSPKRVIETFQALGLLCKEETEGRVYPYSLQAAAVLDLLRLKAEALHIETICYCCVIGLKASNQKFVLTTSSQETIVAEQVIIATGGKSAPQLGSHGSGYLLAKQMGHAVTSVYPALTLLRTPPEYVKSLKGMRSHAVATLLCNRKVIRHEKGEVQFTEHGLSGICMFQFSRHVAMGIANKNKLSVSLDFMPEYSVATLVDHLTHIVKIYPQIPAIEILSGFINKRVGQAVVKTALANSNATLSGQLSKSEIMLIANMIKRFLFPCIGVADWKQAQATAGGVSLEQLTESLESRLHCGLYFAGELLNIDGDCGGYNLHWAWISGMTAGKAAGKNLRNKSKART